MEDMSLFRRALGSTVVSFCAILVASAGSIALFEYPHVVLLLVSPSPRDFSELFDSSFSTVDLGSSVEEVSSLVVCSGALLESFLCCSSCFFSRYALYCWTVLPTGN